MSEHELRQFIDSRAASLMRHYLSSKEKYEAIWGQYARQMPTCIQTCTSEKTKYSSDTCIDGPQGIYWIGARPRLLFVGREHYGWYGSSKWETDRKNICYSPLEFAYFTIQSLGTYWAVIKEVLRDVLRLDMDDWDGVLANVAFTNACKCLTGNGTFQWFLHQECSRQAYLQHEIATVGAPVNVLFTRSYRLAANLFQDQAEKLEETDEFLVQRANRQVLIDCAHPGRRSHKWRARLKQTIGQYIEGSVSIGLEL